MEQYLYSIVTDNRKSLFAPLIKFFLFSCSLIYLEIVRTILICYRLKILKTYSLPVKAISVGNITLGGTGKTPLVEFIARYLIKQGRKAAILTRGYKREAGSLGDEPHLLRQKLNIPVIVDSNRRRSGNKAKKEFNIDTVILDDGFQQFSIGKDLNILTIDAMNPFGNYYLIPRGILREPLSSIRRADAIIITKVNLAERECLNIIKNNIARHNKRALVLEAEYLLELPNIEKNKICTLTGIASPQSFKKILLNNNFDIAKEFDYPDHYVFKESDIDKIIASCKALSIEIILTTEKDWVRLENFQLNFENCGIKVYALQLKIKIKDEQKLFSRLNSLYLD